MAAKQASLFTFFRPKSVPKAPKGVAEPVAAAEEPGKAALVGKRVKVWWPKDQEWYTGELRSYDAVAGKHRVVYDDGDEEAIDVDEEKVEYLAAAPAEKAADRALMPVPAPQPAADASESEGEAEFGMPPRRRTAPAAALPASSDDEEEPSRKRRLRRGAKVPKAPKTPKTPAAGDESDASFIVDDASEASNASDSDASDASDAMDEEVPPPPSKKRGRATPRATPTKKPRLTPTPTRAATPTSTPSSGSYKLAALRTPSASGEGVVLKEGVLPEGMHEHNSWAFLGADRRDSQGLRPDAPGFNPRTLKLPKLFLEGKHRDPGTGAVIPKQTPAMQQWWSFKAKNMDTVLFFKVGKFYELFHMDSDVGFQHLDLIYMKGTKGHSGFPESAAGRMAERLVEKGYRVAKVEQIETPAMLAQRKKAAGGKAKGATNVVRRNLVSVLTPGTRTHGILDDEAAPPPQGRFLLSLTERVHTAGDNQKPSSTADIGVCLVDASNATIDVGQFEDDSQRTRLRTLLSSYQIVELVVPHVSATNADAGLSEVTTAVLSHAVPHALRTPLFGDECWSPARTAKELRKGKYFPSESKCGDDDDAVGGAGTSRWPPLLQYLVSGADDSSLALSALGATTCVLRRCLIDHDVLAMQRFGVYVPPDDGVGERWGEAYEGEASPAATAGAPACDVDGAADEASGPAASGPFYVALDAAALSTLEIFRNNSDGTAAHSLLAFLDHCKTAFGKRRLFHWVSRPLARAKEIKIRQTCVENLLSALPEADASRDLLSGLPDLERMLTQIHTLGSEHRAEDHPSRQAILYDTHIYDAKKIKLFAKCLEGVRSLARMPEVWEAGVATSPLLRKLVQKRGAGGAFPDLDEVIREFDGLYDEAKALKTGKIEPLPGMDPTFDALSEGVREANAGLQEHLFEMQGHLKCKAVKFVTAGKDTFLLEVPEAVAKKQCQGREWIEKRGKKGVQRYDTKAIEKLRAALVKATEQLTLASADATRRVFARFSRHAPTLRQAVSLMGALDSLLSLAEIAGFPNYTKPEILDPASENGGSSYLEIRAGRHPMVAATMDGEFIPNDVTLGKRVGDVTEEGLPALLLLSGPNMGGKSTFLRQTCLLTLLAQIGSFVPAARLVLTPFQRLYTRLGASDRILQGQSTFFVELAECASILKFGNERSLCILDELGRGTSTFDGTAIAHAVVEGLVEQRSVSLFATHYHSLVQDFEPRREEAQIAHMGCLHDTASGEVTFLYKLQNGPSQSSYGINVARLAGLPTSVIDLAEAKAREFQEAVERKRQ